MIASSVSVGQSSTPINKTEERTQMSNEERSALEIEREKMEAAAKEENETRSGKGTRVQVGATRGKSTMNIKYEAFDLTVPASLPETVAEFVSLTGTTAEEDLVRFLIDGYNDYQYRQASDPIAEFVENGWPDELKTAFRSTVRGLVKGGLTLERAVGMVKPGFVTAAAALSA